MSHARNHMRKAVEKWLNSNGYSAPNTQKTTQAFIDHWDRVTGQHRASLKLVGVHLSDRDASRLTRHLRGKGYSGVTVRTSTKNMNTPRGTEYYTGMRVIINA